jgi:hypothetical protein
MPFTVRSGGFADDRRYGLGQQATDILREWLAFSQPPNPGIIESAAQLDAVLSEPLRCDVPAGIQDLVGEVSCDVPNENGDDSPDRPQCGRGQGR